MLLVDFGASRVKCALWSTKRQCVIAEIDVPAPKPHYGSQGEVEVDPESYWQALEATAGQLIDQNHEVKSLWLCTEMHGVLLGSAEDGVPLTPYISWRDERASQPGHNESPSTFHRCHKNAEEFQRESGMNLRLGLPFLTLAHLAELNQIPAAFRLFTLADWLLWRGGERAPGIHESLAAGTGFFSLRTRKWSKFLVQSAGLDSSHVLFPDIIQAGKPIGKIRLGGRSIEVYGGIGDLQAASWGGGFPAQARILINLGTGSQVLGAVSDMLDGIDRRPGVKGIDFAAITHIPSGRAFNVFADFMDECAILGGGIPFFWDIFASLTAENVIKSKISIDLGVFESAWNYQNGGHIKKIIEGQFSPENLIASLAHAWLNQYVKAMELIDPNHNCKTFLLSGGLARRGAFVLPVLEYLSQRQGSFAETITGEETLDGLLALSGQRIK
jgi:hypothetical protein